MRIVRANALYLAEGKTLPQLVRLFGGDARGKRGAFMFHQPREDLAQRCHGFTFREHNFGKTAAAFAVEIQSHVRKLPRCRLHALGKKVVVG